LAERIGTIKARGRKPGNQKAGKSESREIRKPGNQKAGKHRVTESTEPGRQKAGKHRVTESTEPGRQKAGKHRVTESTEPGRQKAGSIRPGNTESSENTERKIAMAGACLGDGQSRKDLQWTVLDATV
jgi:hypothetical protein